MRLTLINQFYTPDISPTAHLCASLAEHRAHQGDAVTVLTSDTGYLTAVAHKEMSNSVHVRRLWSTRLGSRTNLRRLLDWLTFYPSAIGAAAMMPRQDVVICLTTPPFIALAGWIHKLLHPQARLILWNMDVYPEALERTHLIDTEGLVATVMRAIHRAIFRRLDHLVCLDEAMLHLLVSQYTPQGRFIPSTLIPNWEKSELFLDGASTGELEPRLAAAMSGRFVVLYLGNAGYGHEFGTLIDSAEVLRDLPVTFLFVGGGAMQQWIVDQCAQRRLSNIIFHKYIPKRETPALMRRADCALITLENSMLGVMSPSKLHANLAMGLPIIYVGPKQSNVDEAIIRFHCGISLRPGDARGLAAWIESLLSNSEKHELMRRNARKAFDERYCDEKTLPLFDKIISTTSENTKS